MAQKAQARLGILMLDTRFPRIPGDVGHAGSWPFPMRYGVVPGATPEAIVRADPAPFVDAFIDMGRSLVADGCSGIATTCGFLALLRPRLAEALGVPVAASALEQAGQIAASLPPEKRLGVLTISADSLTQRHLDVAGVPAGTVVAGMEGSHFAETILGNRPELNVPLARQEMCERAVAMVQDDPDIGALLLECTNMVPYARDLAAATGRPVYSIHSYLRWFHEGLLPSAFDD